MNDFNDTVVARRRGRPRNSAVDGILNDPAIHSASEEVSIRSEQRKPIRRRKNMNTTDRYYVDPSRIPAGMSYEWKRATIYGQEDKEHQIDTYENGFTPVPANRHPELAGRNANPNSEILRGGLILMERPIELRNEAIDEQNQAAANLPSTQMKRLGITKQGELDRHVSKARRTIERGDISVDD